MGGGRDGWAETLFTSVDTISPDLKADREARHKSQRQLGQETEATGFRPTKTETWTARRGHRRGKSLLQ